MSKPKTKIRMHRPGASTPADAMYAAHEKVYPREVKGRYQSLRTLAVFTLLGLYYLLPWIHWDQRQAILFDLPARKFYIFGLIFWPQDFFYLALLLILAALSLFFFTALAGRLWCGYACPQTVWTEVFLWMEKWTEGDRSKRMKLDAGPWNREKILRKTAKQLLWVGFAAFTGFTFVGYFTPIEVLGRELVHLNLGSWELFWIVFYGIATYGNAGFLREQVCMYMCPYARFQSAMFDRNTLIISYDPERGEPRGGRKRGVDPKTVNLGDCIDCNLCVQVCPTGIDIRNGLQYECIACAACIDVCNGVMDKMAYPRGLIRYTTQNAVDKIVTRVLRPRVIVYGILLFAIAAGFVTALALREPVAMDVLHDRNALYRLVGDESVENVYLLKIMNKDIKPHTYRVEASGLKDIRIETDPETIVVQPGEVLGVAARVRTELDHVHGGGANIKLVLRSVDGSNMTHTETTRFLAPRNR